MFGRTGSAVVSSWCSQEIGFQERLRKQVPFVVESVDVPLKKLHSERVRAQGSHVYEWVGSFGGGGVFFLLDDDFRYFCQRNFFQVMSCSILYRKVNIIGNQQTVDI